MNHNLGMPILKIFDAILSNVSAINFILNINHKLTFISLLK